MFNPYNQQVSLVTILFKIIIIGAIFCYIYFGVIHKPLPNFINKIKIPENNTLFDTQKVLEERDWCKAQVLNVGDSKEDPIWSKIMGFDTINNCCVEEYYGYDCALNKTLSIRYCYTSIIGGHVVWITVDGYYKIADNYKKYIDNLDKEHISNKFCSEVK